MIARAALSLLPALLVGCAAIDTEPDLRLDSNIVQCPVTAVAVTTDGCEVAVSGGPDTLIVGTILAEDTVFRNGAVLIGADGRIVDVGCDVHATERAASATVLACSGGIVSPGLINPHDHIWYNHRPPSKFTDERYEHRHHWRLGLQGHTQPDFERAAASDKVAWGELRHALSGTTAIAGMGGVAGLVRNLEDAELNGDLETAAAFATVFPLGDAGGSMLIGSCDYPEVVDPAAFAAAGSFQAHVAEGVDRSAANEVGCLTGRNIGGVDVSETPAAFVHFVGGTTDDAIFMRDRGVSVIWSPRSNIALYGHTANVTLLDRLGINIALSTDWLPSGSMNLLRELQCAADYSDNYLDGYFSSYDLWQMVTANAARSFALQDELGSLAAGRLADIAVFRGGTASDPYQEIIDADSSDVLLVLRSGRPLIGKAGLINALDSNCETLPVELGCGDEIAVCMNSEMGGQLHDLLAANLESYSLMSCGGVPEGEPTCQPSWPGQFDGIAVTGRDDDGDGVANRVDNCPAVFNPPRPMDDGLQPDWDQDTAGDACDESPLE